MKQREKGETYRPNVKIEKLKAGVPSVVTISGRRYVLDYRTHEKEQKRRGASSQTRTH